MTIRQRKPLLLRMASGVTLFLTPTARDTRPVAENGRDDPRDILLGRCRRASSAAFYARWSMRQSVPNGRRSSPNSSHNARTLASDSMERSRWAGLRV